MTVYALGHIKHDVENNEVALRTAFPEDQGPQLARLAWVISSPSSGARNAVTAEVEDWPDLYVPEPVVETPPVIEG